MRWRCGAIRVVSWNGCARCRRRCGSRPSTARRRRLRQADRQVFVIEVGAAPPATIIEGASRSSCVGAAASASLDARWLRQDDPRVPGACARPAGQHRRHRARRVPANAAAKDSRPQLRQTAHAKGWRRRCGIRKTPPSQREIDGVLLQQRQNPRPAPRRHRPLAASRKKARATTSSACAYHAKSSMTVVTCATACLTRGFVVGIGHQRQQRLNQPRQVPARDQRLVAVGVAAAWSMLLNTAAGS